MPSSRIHPGGPAPMSTPPTIVSPSQRLGRKSFTLNKDMVGAAESAHDQQRPSIWLQTIAGGLTTSTLERTKYDEEALVKWLNTELIGHQLKMPGTTKVITGAPDVVSAGLIGKEIHNWFKKEQNAIKTIKDTSFLESGKEFIAEFAQVTDLTESAFTGFVDNIPLVGMCYNVFKAAGLSVSLIITKCRSRDAENRRRTSISVIEREALSGALEEYSKEIHLDALNAVGATAKAVTAPVGLSGLAGIPFAITEFIIKTYRLITMMNNVGDVNAQLKTGTLKFDCLEKVPILALMLPHLKGVNTLTLLGIMPPGFNKNSIIAGSDEEAMYKRINEEIAKPNNRWFGQSIYTLLPIDAGFQTNNGWRGDLGRLKKLYFDTNLHIFEAKYELYDRTDKQVYIAPPQNNYQAIKKYCKGKALIIKEELKKPSRRHKVKSALIYVPLKNVFKKIKKGVSDLKDYKDLNVIPEPEKGVKIYPEIEAEATAFQKIKNLISYEFTLVKETFFDDTKEIKDSQLPAEIQDTASDGTLVTIIYEKGLDPKTEYAVQEFYNVLEKLETPKPK